MLSELVHCLFALLLIGRSMIYMGKAGSQRQAIKSYIDMRIYINISFVLLTVIRDACMCLFPVQSSTPYLALCLHDLLIDI